MKTLLIIINIFLSIFQPIKQVNAENISYAQITQSGSYLYKTPQDNTNYSNVFYILENSYYVQLLSDYNNEFYKARYIDTVGFVKKSQVQCVQGSPKTPYLNNIKFRVYSNSSRGMYDKPFANSNNPTLKVYLPLYCEDLIYYGKIYGESVIEERTNIWYYCKYTITNECGYVYSDACDKMSSIVSNTEKLPYISSPEWNTTPTNTPLVVIDSKPFKITTLLISIPFIIFLILLFKFAIVKRGNKNEIDTFNNFE